MKCIKEIREPTRFDIMQQNNTARHFVFKKVHRPPPKIKNKVIFECAPLVFGKNIHYLAKTYFLWYSIPVELSTAKLKILRGSLQKIEKLTPYERLFSKSNGGLQPLAALRHNPFKRRSLSCPNLIIQFLQLSSRPSPMCASKVKGEAVEQTSEREHYNLHEI